MSVTEPQSPSAVAQLALFLARKGRRVWPLTVESKHTVTPRMTRVRFTVPALDELIWKRGQDLVLELPQQGDAIARRHYTIRDIDGATLAIDFVNHGESPAGRWLAAAAPGSRIDAAGPRGHTFLHAADWHLFTGDETAIPAIFAMLEGLPADAKAYTFIEIADNAERQRAPDGANVVWLSRKGAAPGPSCLLADAVEAFATSKKGRQPNLGNF
ncbi:MAG TPA: siderophore-interacting protein [Rhizomicrobium sp.]|nr:siderophore-interacting protein [Rhizomicrobium sp.]